jgi:hypothetical protein
MSFGGAGIPGATQVSAMGTLNAQSPSNPKPADNSTQDSSPGADDASSTDTKAANPTTGNKPQTTQGTFGSNSTGPVFGGGPILGVASTSKDTSIREFNKKKHYNEWQFIYDPSIDRGGLLTMPNQQSVQGGGLSQMGQPGQFQQAAPGVGAPQGGQSGQPQQFGQPPVNTNQPPPDQNPNQQ